MHKSLVILAFQKARKERRKIGDNKPSLKKLAEDLASEIDYKVGERSLRDYYNNAKKLNGSVEDISIGQLPVVTDLSQYLGFEDYEDFINSSTRKQAKKEPEPQEEQGSEGKKSVIIIKERERYTKSQDYESSSRNMESEEKNIKIWFKRNKSIVIIISLLLLMSNVIIN